MPMPTFAYPLGTSPACAFALGLFCALAQPSVAQDLSEAPVAPREFTPREFAAGEDVAADEEWAFRMVIAEGGKLRIAPDEEPLKMIPVLLHAGYGPEEVMARLDIGERELLTRLELLEDHGFVVARDGGGYGAAVMVVSAAEAAALTEQLEPLIAEVTASVEAEAPRVKALAQRTPCLNRFSFEALSPLLLSNTLLYDGQLAAIESDYLGAERPLHRRKRYYAAYGGYAADSPLEPWGLYGNHVVEVDGARVHGFGNLRRTPEAAAAAEGLGVAYARVTDKSALPCPVVDEACAAALRDVAAAYRPTLLLILDAHDEDLRAQYAASAYAAEVTYAQYFVWAYHLACSRATERLIARGVIAAPDDGVSEYIVVQ